MSHLLAATEMVVVGAERYRSQLGLYWMEEISFYRSDNSENGIPWLSRLTSKLCH